MILLKMQHWAFSAHPLVSWEPFSARFLATYNTVQLLQSEECKQALLAAAAVIRGSTFSTERVHSQNSRKAAHRVQTAQMDVATLALHHAAQCEFSLVEAKGAKEETEAQKKGQ